MGPRGHACGEVWGASPRPRAAERRPQARRGHALPPMFVTAPVFHAEMSPLKAVALWNTAPPPPHDTRAGCYGVRAPRQASVPHGRREGREGGVCQCYRCAEAVREPHAAG